MANALKLNTAVELEPQHDAKLIVNGYEPIPVLGKRPAAKGWTSGEITIGRLAEERMAHAGAKSTGLRTGRLVGIDIDVVNEEDVERIVRVTTEELGATSLIRVGSKGRLLLYRNETPIYKIAIATQGKEKVEIMGLGQQVVAFGVHPDTAKPYLWVGGDDPEFADEPLSVSLAELPEVTPSLLRAFAQTLRPMLTEMGYGPARLTGDIADEGRKDVSLAAGHPVTAATLRSACAYLDPGAPRDKWIRWIAGIRSAPLIGDDDCSIRRQIAHELSVGDLDRLKRGRPANYAGPDDVDAVFDSLPPKNKGVTVGTLFKEARNAGWTGSTFSAATIGVLKQENLPALGSPALQPAETVALPAFPDRYENGTPRPTCENTRVAIQALGIECRYDAFHNKMLLGGHAIGQWAGELSDYACLMLRRLIRHYFGFEPNAATALDAAQGLCLQRRFDPVCDYLDGVKWDGVKRLDKWLITYMGAPDTPFVREVGRIALVAAVRRARKPGTKFDQIIVLEGPEGISKSTAIEVMAGKENFSDQSILGLDDRSQQERLAGIWLYEIADLTGISKTDVDRVKAFASRSTDRARPAYGRTPIDQPRRCVLFATTNNDTYLQSQTGNRRFWSIKTTKVDIEKLRADRDQLWAEAAYEESEGASIVLPTELWAVAAAEQSDRLHVDPWEDILAGVKGTVVPDPDDLGDEERISTKVLLDQYLKISPERQHYGSYNRLKSVMRRLGWQGPDQLRIDAQKARGYRRSVERSVGDDDGGHSEMPVPEVPSK